MAIYGLSPIAMVSGNTTARISPTTRSGKWGKIDPVFSIYKDNQGDLWLVTEQLHSDSMGIHLKGSVREAHFHKPIKGISESEFANSVDKSRKNK